jgi:SAM-dependent methyltransferase
VALSPPELQWRAIWERASPAYETELPYFRLMGERTVAHAALRSGQDVLDVACGKGAVLVPAAKAVAPTGRALGVDAVAAMVDGARAAIAAAGLVNAEARLADVEHLDISDASVDVVTCAMSLYFFGRPDRALAEMRRVLRPGGRLLVTTPTGGGPEWEFFGELCAEFGIAMPAPPGAALLRDPEHTCEVIRSSGFTELRRMTDVVHVDFPGEQAWWRWAWSHGMRSALEQLGPEREPAFRERAFAALRAFATPTGIPLDQRFEVVSALTG